MEEVFKPITDFPGYEISNYGRIKSFKSGKETFLKPSVNPYGYEQIALNLNGSLKTKKIHKLVAIEFLNHIPNGMKSVVNHIDHNRLNNKVENLEIISQRENTDRIHLKSSSVYTGVSYFKITRKWAARILIKGKQKHIGYFNSEIEASNAYQKVLKQTQDNL